MVAFSLFFVATLFKGPFHINVEVFGFSMHRSYTILAFFFLGASWDAEDRIILDYISRPFGLSLYVLGNVPPRLRP